MPSTIAHAISASWIAMAAFNVRSDETSHILAALVSASILDLDHVICVVRDRDLVQYLGRPGHLHHLRSPLHELPGLLLAGAVSVILFSIDRRLACIVFTAYAIHIVQDWLIGRSCPLSPIDKTEVQFFSLSLKQKAIIDVTMVVVFGALWIPYLTGLA